MLTQDLIARARTVIRGAVRETPLESSPALELLLGVPVFLKLECLQVTGSFKVRGALFALSESGGDGPVITCSAGNHGIGLAWAGARLGREVRVVVPGSVDAYKAQALADLGATVLRAPFPGFDDSEAWARDQGQTMGIPFISAYDDALIAAGNGGTTGREIAEQANTEALSIVTPVGGGGLAAGLATALPEAQIIGTQVQACPALRLSLERGAAVTRMEPADTLAGGLEGGLGRLPFGILRDRISRVWEASEEDLLDAMRWMINHHHYLMEPSCAPAVAAALRGALDDLEGPVVVVITGRNVALDTVRKALA